MKKVFLFVAYMIIFIGCSKKNEESPQPTEGNSQDAELYEEVSNKLVDFLQNNPTTEINDVVEYASGLDAVTSCEIRDSILYIITKGQYEYVCDWYGLCHAEPIDETFNSEEFDKLVDSLETVWGYKPWNEGGTLVDEEVETEDNDTDENGIEVSLATKSGTDVRFLTRKNVMIWCPWPALQEDTSLFTYILSKFRVNISFSSNLSSVQSFNHYDLIIVYTHGSPQGEIVIPVSSKSVYKKEIEAKIMSGGSVKYGNKIIPCLFLGKNYFQKYLPSDMSHTILWTIACYLGRSNSEFLSVAKKKNVADFFGADNQCKLTGPYWRFLDFAPRFFNGFTSAKAFYNGRQYYPDGCFIEGVYYKYNYWRRGNSQVCYVEPLTGRPSQAGIYSCTVQAGIHYPSELNTEIFSTGKVKMGIRLVNKKNNQSWDFSISSGNIYETFNFTDGMSIRSYPVTLTGLEPETSYKYYAYSIINGRRIWAKYSHSFTTGKEDGESLVRKYLVKLYQDTDGDHWFNNTNWCSDKPITEWYGVQYFDGKLDLHLGYNNLRGSIDLSGCTILRFLTCDDNQIISANFSECIALQSFSFKHCPIKSIVLSNCTSLKELDFNKYDAIEIDDVPDLSSLDVSGCSALESLSCANRKLINLDIRNCSQLRVIGCGGNQLTKLDLVGCLKLQELHCINNQLASLDLTNLTKLAYLGCGDNQLTKLILTGCSALEQITCEDNQIKELDLSYCPLLRYVFCENNLLELVNLGSLAYSDLYGSIIDFGFLETASYSSTKLKIISSEMTFLSIQLPDLQTLDLSECPKLENLRCAGQIKSLDLSKCKNLTQFSCIQLPLEVLNLGDNNITNLRFEEDFYITALTSTKFQLISSKIEELYIRSKILRTLDLSKCPALKFLNCMDTNICCEIPLYFKNITFLYDRRYTDYWHDDLGVLHYTDNGVGWWYPGEPQKGYHGW